MELVMSGLLLVCFLLLSRQAAQVSGTMKEQENRKEIIAVDPGHGGADPGMVGLNGLEEKEINLKIACKLERVLTDKGYQVVMTRKKDQGLYDASAPNKKSQDMQRRIAFLEKASPVLTVSIHQNSYSDPGIKGPQVFYYETSREGKRLAQEVQESMNRKLLPERPRGIKGNTSYYLLKRSKGTLIIVECGFLTNPEEAALLQKEEYQQKVAQAVADGIESYLSSRK